MPNWSDENGRYWWGRYLRAVEVPHPPLNQDPEPDCGCEYCEWLARGRPVEGDRDR